MSAISLWVEKYRPRKVEDVILPDSLKLPFLKMVEEGEIPNLILESGPGTGKTTIAKALCDQIGCDWIVINGSDESGIDVLRNKVKNFASTSSITSEAKHKVVIFDEADYLNANSTQPALRNMIEEFSRTCRFIFTCNYKNRIIPPLHSRCAVISFAVAPKDAPTVAAAFMKRVCWILDTEKVSYDKASIAALIKRFFPDMRRVLNELQNYSKAGKIDSGILSGVPEAKLDALIGYMKDKNFKDIRTFFAENPDFSSAELFASFYKALSANLEPPSIPQAVLILADYQYKAAFVVNHEINMTACCVALMMECQFK